MSDTTPKPDTAPKARPHVFAVRIVDEGTAPNDGVRAVTQFMEARPPPEPLDERTVILAGRRLRVVLRGPCYLDAPIDDGATGEPAPDSMTPNQQAVVRGVPENDAERCVDMNLHRLLLTLNRKRAMAEIAPENAVAVLRRMKALAIGPDEQLVQLTVDGCLRSCVECAEVGLESQVLYAQPAVARRLAAAGLAVRRQLTFEGPFVEVGLHRLPTGGFGPALDSQNDADWEVADPSTFHYRVSWAKEPA